MTALSVLEDALRTFLALEQRPRARHRTTLPTFNGGGLQPGVDLDNTADLLDLMERPDGAR